MLTSPGLLSAVRNDLSSLCPFLIIFQISIDFFSACKPSSQYKRLAVILIQLEFQNRLIPRCKWMQIRRNGTFTQGLGLALNNIYSFGIIRQLLDESFSQTFCWCVPHAKFLHFFHKSFRLGNICWALFCCFPSMFLKMLATDFMQLLDMMMNRFFMFVHHFECHLDLN